MKKVCVLTAAGLLFTSLAAHAVDDTYLFESMSVVEHTTSTQFGNNTVLTGVIAGVATTITVPANSDVVGARCAKYYDVMLEQQGEYSLSLTVNTTTYPSPGGSTTVRSLVKCSLTRIP